MRKLGFHTFISCFNFVCFSLVTVYQDLANQIRFSKEYQDVMKHLGRTPGKYIHPEVGEYFSGWVDLIFFPEDWFNARHAGLPRGWTEPKAGSVNADHFKEMFPDALSKAH